MKRRNRKLIMVIALCLVAVCFCSLLLCNVGCASYEDAPSENDDKAPVIEEPENPEEPEEPEEPENPDDPENPENPENPEEPENPDDPENPENPENPEKPENPDDPENPEKPENPEEPEKPKDPEKPTEKSVYFYNFRGWESCYAYAWDDSEQKYLGEWSGKEMSAEADGWFCISINTAATKIVFNNGGEHAQQTEDLSLDFNKPYFYQDEWLANKPVPAKDLTVYYSNNLGWENVYAYLWKEGESVPKAAWPGEACKSLGVSALGEEQYSFTASPKDYNRIIFNDGGGNQTKNLCFNNAQSGFYGLDNTFVYGIADNEYGKTEYYTVTDSKNIDWKGDDHTKKISVYTPYGYDPQKKYGVLYMFDGQNLYAGATGAEATKDGFGSWATDVAVRAHMANGAEGIIIVGIDNADGYRDMELTMSQSFGALVEEITKENGSVNQKFYNGQLEKLSDFVIETLMPFVAERYSVDDSLENTGIAGSSSGGLAAYYVGMSNLGTFGYIGAFSPANALFTDSAWADYYKTLDFTAENSPNIYVYCGSGDGFLEDQLIDASRKIKGQLSQTDYSGKVREYYSSSSEHTEVWWRIAFTEFIAD